MDIWRSPRHTHVTRSQIDQQTKRKVYQCQTASFQSKKSKKIQKIISPLLVTGPLIHKIAQFIYLNFLYLWVTTEHVALSPTCSPLSPVSLYISWCNMTIQCTVHNYFVIIISLPCSEFTFIFHFMMTDLHHDRIYLVKEYMIKVQDIF